MHWRVLILAHPPLAADICDLFWWITPDPAEHSNECKCSVQVVHLEEDEREGEDATAFYSALGASDPSLVSIKGAAH